MGAAALIAGAGFALGQEATSADPTLRRVQFRNGNTIECQIESVGEKDLTINVQGKRFRVQRDDVVSVETLKSCSVPEKPKAGSRGKAPALDPALRSKLDGLLAQYANASAPLKDQLTQELAHPGVGTYLASQLDRCSDESLPYVIRVISEQQDEEAYPYVMACLDSDRAPVVCAALVLSGRWESRSSVARVLRFLSDSRPSVRAAAIESLRLAGDERSLPTIALEMSSKDGVVRASAINACLDLGRRLAKMDLVVGQLKDGILRAQGPVLEDLLEAAGRSGSSELVEPLIRSLKDGDPAVRIKAVGGLTQLRSAAGARAMVQQLKVDDSVAVRIHLAGAAAALKSADAIPVLIENLRDRDQELVRECRQALQTLTKQDHGDDYNSWALWWETARRS
jgi:HEAT repeat protein